MFDDGVAEAILVDELSGRICWRFFIYWTGTLFGRTALAIWEEHTINNVNQAIKCRLIEL
jgi:hypothetical protein